MKNKPQRHKESNVFRFKSFGDRITEIDLRRTALYHIRHENEETSEEEKATEFHQTYCKWIVLNLTEEFAVFHKKVRDIVTLEQLFWKRDFVIEHLIESIEKATSLSLQPLLEFVVALAKDLGKEFYPHFVNTEKSFLSILIRLLDTKESDQLEWTLICLAYLFKCLKPYLKKDITTVFDALIPLLDSRSADHVTNFAAECFSFVVRDIKDKEKFLLAILSKLNVKIEDGVRQSEILTRGCGQLLFEIVRGVNGLFHSCAESYLRIYFEILAKVKPKQVHLMYDVLGETISSMLQQITPVNMQTFWDAAYSTIEQFLHDAEKNELALSRMLLLMGIALETRDGKYLMNPSQFVTTLLKVTNADNISNDCLRTTSELVAALLLSKNVILSQLDASRISKRILTIPSAEIFESFVWNCVNFSQFEILILPEFLRYLDSKYFSLNALELMAKIILKKSPLCGDGVILSDRSGYPIQMRSVKCFKKIEKILTDTKENETFLENPREFLLALIVYSNIIGADKTNVMTKIDAMIDICLVSLKPHDPETCAESESFEIRTKNKRIIFTLSILVECKIQLNGQQSDANVTVHKFQLKKLVEKLVPFAHCENFSYVHGLRVLDLIITYESNQSKMERNPDFNVDLFAKIHNQISNNLSSRYHEVRRITSHLFQQFESELKLDDEFKIYSIFSAIESVDPNVHTYREQLLLFQRIEPNDRFIATLQNAHDTIKLDPLKYLLGLLYVNFNLLWKPTIDLITTYFDELDIEEFWTLFKMKIDETTALQRLGIPGNVTDDLEFIEQGTCLGEQYLEIWRNNERTIDLVNYRILLWRMIPLLGMLREIKNREIVTIFLDFIEHEYKRTTDRDSLSWQAQRNRKPKKNKNHAQNQTTSDAEIDKNTKVNDDDDNDDDDDDDDDNNEAAEVGKSTDEQNIPKGTQRTLIQMLQVFVNQNNPKQLHREPELWNLYMELLTHRNSAVQKLALDCVIAYKHKYLQPYKDHLYSLVDDSKFKEGISNFKIDKESSIVQPEHRPQLMPIVMRILFSKMLMRVGGQKTPNQLRKSLVMRFLGGCHENEILIMLNMSFWMFESEFAADAREMCLNVMTKTNVTNVLSPSILQSSLDLIDVIQAEFSGLMSDQFLRYIINILLVIGSIIQTILQQRQDADTKFTSDMVKPFKNLRNKCLQNLQRFFDHFDAYNWSDSEIEAIFLIFISPTAAKLSQESQMAVTPLLKLFSIFGKSPRLFVLLTRYTAITIENTDTTPLKYVMDLLIEPKAKSLVCLTIMEMIQNLLTFSDDFSKNGIESKPLEIMQCKSIDEQYLAEIPMADNLNFGSKILLPYLPHILQKFRMNLRSRRGLTKRDLFILSRITELIVDAETSNTLLTVLLPILVRKSNRSTGEEVLVQMITTIGNLFKRIERPERHLRSIAPMFEQITAVGPRKLLCDILKVIYERCPSDETEQKDQLKQLYEIVSALNALDRRWIEQPDYEKRLEAYKIIGRLTATDAINLNIGILVIYHSFYFIKHDKDMALRDSASHHLRTMVPTLIRKLQRNRSQQDLDYLIGNVLLNLVRRTFRDKNDNVRNEGIQLLGEISRECPDAHPVLDDLHKLTCKQDREIDFFDNITHLQLQRHGKALLRFGSIAKTLEVAPNPRTLTQFILPLASMYISCEKYAAKHGLVTSAIETIGAVCHLLPWHQYETILKYYIKNMRYNVEYQKQMVRIVMQILDAFHFDLSKANVLPKELPKVNVEELMTDKIKPAEDETSKNHPIDEKSLPEKEDDGSEEMIIQADNTDAENFDEELDALNQAEPEDDTNEEMETAVKKMRICIYDTPVVLSQSISRKIIHNIATTLVPTLNNSITALSTYESFHKLNKKKRRSEREEEEILRVPIALAIVKLLQKMPSGMLEQYISGILIKVCMFLKSPLISVRMTTRDILKTIMQTIGADHLEMLLGHMTSLLTRGFQVHVLTITVHSLLDALKTSLKNGIMDKCLQYVLNVCLRDIFGQTGEEKEISKIGKRTQEAKPHNKSFLTLCICASNLTQSSLLDLLVPFKEQLTRSQSKKIVLRVQECFQKIVAGLTVNKQINIETMLMFIYGVISESIPDLLPGVEQPKLSEKEKEKIRRQRPDCFLIPEDPASKGRSNAVRKIVVTNVRANAHVIIEFGLELLQLTLKRGKLMKIEYQPFIDPIVPILCDSLASAHVRVTTFALKCISIMFSKEMTSNRLDEMISKMVEQIFSLLHKYVAANTDMSADNFNLVQSSFKTIVNILRYVPATKFILMEEQLKTLLFYAEQYLNIGEATKQTIAFSLLKVIISRKLITQQLNNVLMQVGRLAIQSDSDVARQESKGIIVNYLMEYPLGKKIDGFIEFFISNLSYELQSGRESAINILHSITKRFPTKYLNRKCALIFVSCGSRLINDESAECRQHIAECIETLLVRIDSNQRNELFAIVLTLLNDEKSCHREMAALLCTRFINAEKKNFADRIPKILPILIATLSLSRNGGNQIAGKFVRNPNTVQGSNNSDDDDDDDNDEENQDDADDRQRIIDHQLIQLQNTILKIFETYTNVFIDYPHYADELAYESQKLLGYEHVWVRLNALKALQLIMRHIDSDEIQHKLITGKTKKNRSNQLDYLYTNSEQEIKSLTLDLCAQMIPEQTDKEMADGVTMILLFIANILKNVPIGVVCCDQDPDNDNDDEYEEKDPGSSDKRKVNLPWLMRRLRYVIHAEVAKAPQNIILRSAVFNWIEGLTELITAEQLNSLSYTLLTPLVREMSEEDQNIDAKLRRIALRVGDSIRNKIGDDEYNLLRAQIQKRLMVRRAERKKLIAIEKISNPVRAAKRQQGIRDRKKTAKRRHMVAVKNRVAPLKKRKKNHLDDD